MSIESFVIQYHNVIISLIIFLSIVIVTLSKWEYRVPSSILGVSILLLMNILTYQDLLKYMNFNIVLFLLAMMIIVGYLEENNFFTYLTSKIIKYMHGSGIRTLIILMMVSAFFSAVVDQVTAILFLSALSLELASLYDVDPYPLILAILYSIIIGGTATVIGDPVSLIIAFEGGLTMADFLTWAAPIALGSLAILIVYILIIFRKYVKTLTRNMKERIIEDVIKTLLSRGIRRPLFSFIVLLVTLGLIASHTLITLVLNTYLNTNVDPLTVLLVAPLLISSIILITDPEIGKRIVTHRVDWDTLLFFIFFFTVVGSLDKTGLLNILSVRIIEFSGYSPLRIYLLISILTGFLSIFVANVLTVATIAPLLHILSKNIYVFPTWWGLLFSSVYMGLSTPIGTTAGLVLLGILDKRRIKRISTFEWLKIGLPIAIGITIFALLMIFIKLF